MENSLNINQSNLGDIQFFMEHFANAPVGILIFDQDYKVEFVNDNFFNFRGIKKEALLGEVLWDSDLVNYLDLKNELNQLKSGEFFEKVVTSIKRASGDSLSILAKGAPTFRQNNFAGGIIILEDIINRSETESGTVFENNYVKTLLRNFSDYYCLVDPGKQILHYSNLREDEITDFIDDERAHTTENFFIPKISEVIDKLFYKVLASKESKEIFKDVYLKEKIVNIKLNAVPFLDEKNNIKFLIILLENKSGTPFSPSTKEYQSNEIEKLQSITSTVTDGIIFTDMEGKIEFWNAAAKNLFGLSKSQVHGQFIGKVIQEFNQDYFNLLKKELIKNKYWSGDVKIGKQNNLKYLSIKIGISESEGSSGLVFLCSDITERMKNEKALRNSEEKFRDIVTNTLELICSLDLKGKLTYANPNFVKRLGFSRDEMRKLNFNDIIDPNYLLKYDFNLSKLSQRGADYFELPLISKSGERIYVLANFTAVYDYNNNPRYFNAIMTDITEKKEAEKDLLLARSVFSVSKDGIGVVQNRKFVLVNNSFAAMFGYEKPSQIVNMDPLNFVVQEDSERVRDILNNYAQNRQAPEIVEFIGIKQDGTKLNIEASLTSYSSENKRFIVTVIRDITEQKKAQEKLERSEEQYRSLTENINEFIWSAVKKEGELKANFYTEGTKRITGYFPSEFINNPKLWYKIIHPNDLLDVIKKMKRLYRDPARDSDEIEYRIINKSGNIIWIKNKINVKRDENENEEIQEIYGLVSDITLNKKAEQELQKSTQNLRELNDAKDRFISIISHDLRTPFSSIIGFTDVLLGDSSMDWEKQKQYIQYIKESSQNMLALVNSLLDWTRLQTGRMNFEPDRINAKTVVDKAIQMLSGNAMRKDINLESKLETDVYIHADETLLLQVFNNLISNAIKFTPKNGDIIVKAQPRLEEREYQFSVKDSGVGIKEENISKLFKVDSKFTLKGTEGEKGSGLGLSLVHEIVQKHGGRIWVESREGEGTEIFFTLPVSSTSILLVDNKKRDRLLYAKLLKSIIPKYDVIEVSTGKEAFEKIKQSVPALVISEHDMPEMSGYELVNQLSLADIKYKPPVIILSSDLNNHIIEEYYELGIEYVFPKPVNLSVFKIAIEKSLKKSIF